MAFQIIPPSRPRQPRDTTVEQLLAAGWEPGRYPVALLGVRGYYLDTMGAKGKNDRKIYDDAIFIVGPELAYAGFNANTDPGAFRQGIATLEPGVHLYRKGMHGISRKNPYPAFRPATDGERLPVRRDGQEGIVSGVALNIHKGSRFSVSSEGCQTVFPGQWGEFQKLGYALMDRYSQTRIPYVLIEIPGA